MKDQTFTNKIQISNSDYQYKIIRLYNFDCIFAKNLYKIMPIYNTYIQQISYDGTTYKKGSVVDLLSAFKIVCQEFPFKKNPQPKDLPTRDWVGEDGLDVYIPDKLPMKNYDIEVSFLYKGTEETMRTDLNNFIDFLYGRKKGNNEDTVQSGRLAIYNEHIGMGRKDIVVSDVENEIFYLSDEDPDAFAKFKIKFMVYDPTTEVTPAYSTDNGVKRATQLNFD